MSLRLRRVFATGVIALACVLLVSLTLVGRSLRNVLNVNPGFDARGVLTLPRCLVGEYPNPERWRRFSRRFTVRSRNVWDPARFQSSTNCR